MTKEIMVRGTQEFMGIEIPVIEGGFGEGCKVILAKTVAEIHEVETKRLYQRYMISPLVKSEGLLKIILYVLKKVLMSLIYLNVWATPTRWT